MGKGELITNSLIYRELTISYQVSYFYRRFNYSEFRDVWFIQQPARLRGFTNPLRKWLMSLMLLNLSIAFQTSILAVVVTCAGESEGVELYTDEKKPHREMRRIDIVGIICFNILLYFLNLSPETHTLIHLFLLSHGQIHCENVAGF